MFLILFFFSKIESHSPNIMDAEISGGPQVGQRTANEFGRALIEQYFDILNRFPDQAWRFYAQHGNYRTIYPDGTTVDARDWEEQNEILLRPAPDGVETVVVDSVESTLCGTMDRMMVVASGPRFMQTFLLDRLLGDQRTYAIAASVAHYSATETAVDRPSVDVTAGRPTPEIPVIDTTVDGSTSENAAVRSPSSSAKKPKTASTKNQDRSDDDIATSVALDKDLTLTSVSEDCQRAEAEGQPYASTKLFVGCLPKSVKSQELADLFTEFGTVHYVQVKDGGKTRHGLPSVFNDAFVVFDGPSSIDEALSRSPLRVNGRVLNAKRRVAVGQRSRSML